MSNALKITSPVEPILDRFSSTEEVYAALDAAHAAGAKSPSAVEDQASLPRGTLDHAFANLKGHHHRRPTLLQGCDEGPRKHRKTGGRPLGQQQG